MAMLRIVEIHPEIRANVDANNGYCPCAIWQTPDTKCMCKDFREQADPGECHCGRFEKVEYCNADRCVCCGEIIPEGQMICPNCLVKTKDG